MPNKRTEEDAQREYEEMLTGDPQPYIDELLVLRERIEAVKALIAASQPSMLFGGAWQNGILSVDAVCEAIGMTAPDPTPKPLSETELAELKALIDSRLSRPVGGAVT